MAENSAIEWCDHTFNPWEGCQKVGPGCDHCYAETRNARFGGGFAPNWGPDAPRRRTSPSNWRKPYLWQADAAQFFAAHGRRQRVFCASLADVLDKAAPAGAREDLAKVIRDTPDLDWLILSKRIGNAPLMLFQMFGGDTPPNVALGMTIVNQDELVRDMPKMHRAKYGQGVKTAFLSIEPMLGPVRIAGHLSHIIDWVICGGESGPGARPMHPDWARTLRDDCEIEGIPFLFKQWGEWAPAIGARVTHRWRDGELWAFEGGTIRAHEPGMARVGKKGAGRLLDGRTHDSFPLAEQPA